MTPQELDILIAYAEEQQRRTDQTRLEADAWQDTIDVLRARIFDRELNDGPLLR